MDELARIIGEPVTFLEEVLACVVKEGFDLSDFVQIDHICYRTTSVENYKTKQRELRQVANLLGETLVNERPISTFRLHAPIMYAPWRIDAIELPAPKNDNRYKEGLEHAEFILYDDMPTFLKKYSDKPFEMRAADRGINPEIGLQLGEFSVKFHLLNLPTVVYLERKLGIGAVSD